MKSTCCIRWERYGGDDLNDSSSAKWGIATAEAAAGASSSGVGKLDQLPVWLVC